MRFASWRALLSGHPLKPWEFGTYRGTPPPREFAGRGERVRAILPEPRPWSGEQALMAAVLEEAVGLVVKERTGKGRRLARDEAIRWIASDDHRTPFSFENVCEALNLTPEVVRRAVLG